jgi:hypothetical protein
MALLSSLLRNLLGKPVAADFRDSADHFVAVLREHGIGLSFERSELLFVDDLTERLKGHHEYRDALGCWLGELLVRSFGGQWVPGHALGPAVLVKGPKGNKHLFPLGWVYRRADGGEAESIAAKCQRDLGWPERSAPAELGRFDDRGGRVWPAWVAPEAERGGGTGGRSPPVQPPQAAQD